MARQESKQMINPNNNENIVRHVEIKAYVDNYQSLSARISQIASQQRHAGTSHNTPIDRVQDDTFFHCRSGRLKLRSSGQFHDLIYYRRENDYGPSESFYQSARTKNPAALRTSLTSAFGEAGRVKKFRRTFSIGGSIIHLDRVGGLGDFIEIKVELDSSDAAYAAESCSLSSKSYSSESISCKSLSPAFTPSDTVERGTQRVEKLMRMLDVDLFQLVDGAYVDLINERRQL